MNKRDQDAVLAFFFYTAVLLFGVLLGMPGGVFGLLIVLGSAVLYWDWKRRQ